MGRSLSNLLNSLSEGIHKIKCKYGQDDKKCKACGTEYKYCNCFLEYRFFKGDWIKCKCLSCDKNYQYKFDKKLEKIFINTCKFSNHNNSRFIDLLRKGVYLMNIWMIGKNSMKYHNLKTKIFTFTYIWKILLMQIMHTKKIVKML